jgi:HSP20 family protein
MAAGSRRSGYRVLLPGPADPDKVAATLADGVLTVTVTVPKAEAGKPHRIQITAG